MIKIIKKLGTIVILQVNIEAEHVVFVIQNLMCPINFFIKELANEFEGQFECLGENTEKYETFSVPIETEVTNIDKDGN